MGPCYSGAINRIVSLRIPDRINEVLTRGVNSLTATTWPFIDLDDTGCLTILAKGSKVLQLVREHLAFDWEAEQLHRQHPHLSLAEVHAALGYYYEHRVECDAAVERDENRLAELKHQLVDPGLQERLRGARDRI